MKTPATNLYFVPCHIHVSIKGGWRFVRGFSISRTQLLIIQDWARKGIVLSAAESSLDWGILGRTRGWGRGCRGSRGRGCRRTRGWRRGCRGSLVHAKQLSKNSWCKIIMSGQMSFWLWWFSLYYKSWSDKDHFEKFAKI